MTCMGLFDPLESDEPVDQIRTGNEIISKRMRPAEHDMAKLAIGTVLVRTRLQSALSEGDFHSLPPEPQQGNVEYKLKLLNPTSQRLEHLVTQMKWRLCEGQGEAIYEIGVEDNGVMKGLTDADMTNSMDTLKKMAHRLGATIQVLRDKVMVGEDGPKSVAEVLVRKVPVDRQCILHLRVCVLGSSGVGKSTLLGVLTQGRLDNGGGSARLNMFRHLHEIQTGRTSSISHEILGFDSEGKPVDYSTHSTAEEICEKATKVLTFIDLAGHQKYSRTTMSGITGCAPDYVMLVVNANAGKATVTQVSFLGLAVALDIPFFIILTKVDVTPRPQLQSTLDSIQKVVTAAGSRKVLLVVKTADDLITGASNTLKENVVPIICISSVSGTGLDKLRRFLHLLPPGVGIKAQEKLQLANPEFQIDEIFNMPNVGCIVGGLVMQGVIAEGTTLNLGPFEDGSFRPVTVNTIQRNGAPRRLVRSSQSAGLALDIPVSEVRRGMVLVHPHAKASQATMSFQAKVSLMHHPADLQHGFRTTVHIGNVRQIAKIESIQPVTGTRVNGDKAIVAFRFIRRPEYVKVGALVLFQAGKTKGVGHVADCIGVYNPGDVES